MSLVGSDFRLRAADRSQMSMDELVGFERVHTHDYEDWLANKVKEEVKKVTESDG